MSVRSLDIHKKRVHYKRFSCDQCDKSFANPDTLEHHKNNTHISKFKCNICGFEAKNLKFLNLHKGAKHTTIPLVKGMGMKRDTSTKNKVPSKKAKLSLSPNTEKEGGNKVCTSESSSEESDFEEPKPWSEVPWVNSDKVVAGISIKGKAKKSFKKYSEKVVSLLKKKVKAL